MQIKRSRNEIRGAAETGPPAGPCEFTRYEPVLYPMSINPELATYHDNREIFDAFRISTRRMCCVNSILATVEIATKYGFPVVLK
jgi:hypothetical protein